MFHVLANWIETRRQIRCRWQQDVRVMIERYGRHAYYEAQGFAAHSRAMQDRPGFWHWAKVASKVARLSPAEMDLKTVKAIADEEIQKHRLHRG